MRILLVGEYSRLHNSLKEGLISIGHEVTIVGSGDSFKKYPVDIVLSRGYESGWSKKLKIALLKITGINISEIALRRKFERLKPQLSGYDVVQLINENSFLTTPKLELEIATFLKEHNKKLFLLSCGADYKSIAYIKEGQLPYSILTPYEEGKGEKTHYANALKYRQPAYKKLHEALISLVHGVIASDIDYHLPYEGHPKYLGLIPNPVNVDNISFKELKINDKVIIFRGVNAQNYFAKGQDIFEESLEKLSRLSSRQIEKHNDKIHIITAKNLPYQEYISSYDKAHIIVDQTYSLDQGYNALEAMAKGKVVFTGAGEAFKNRYNLTENVAIDATPDAQEIADTLENLILNPQDIISIGKNARSFIEKEHDYKVIAQRYVDTWESVN